MAIHLNVIAELERRSVNAAVTELNKSFKDQKVDVGVDVKAAEIKAAAERIRREFDDIRAKVKVDIDKDASSKLRDVGQSIKNVDEGAKMATTSLTGLGKAGFGSARGLMTLAAAPAGLALIELTQVSTAATQALWLLPAAATAAGAGIGTLALATSGFADTIKDIRDPKKFAEDIQALSPAAQQAALSIQNLLPAFDQLKNATQDAFFKGMGEQINRLATTYLPSIQNLTTSIAGSFNNMLVGVADQLMTPETQASMQTMFANISQMFQNLTPIAGSLTRAFTDIATVGSGFLPGLATDIANAAEQFAEFVHQARESGQLQVWIQQGIDAVKALASAAGELVQIFYRAFGPESSDNINTFKNDLHGINEAIGFITLDTKTMSASWNEELAGMTGPAALVRDAILDIPEAMGLVINGAVDMANGVKDVVDKMITNLVNDFNHIADIFPDSVNKTLFGTEHPKPFSFTPSADIPYVGRHGETGGAEVKGTWGDWGSYTPPVGALGGGPNAQRQRRGAGPIPNPGAGIPGASPYPGPFGAPPAPPAGGTPSDKDRLDAIMAGLDPNSYRVDPFAPVPGLPSPGGLAGGPMPGGGYGAASAQDFFEGQQAIIQQAHDLEEARKKRLAMERDNQTSAQDLEKAKWDEYQAGVDLQKAQANLVEKTKGTATQAKQGMDELGAALDPDLGLSKGLAGFADNLVRFVGNLAFAPEMARLDALKQSNEAATGITGGYGLFGMAGARNLSQGLSPILGNPLAPGSTGGTAPVGLGGVASSTYAGDAALLANVPTGIGQYDSTTKDLSKGLVDCASGVEDLVNIMDGKSTAGGSLWTGNAASVLPQMGFVPGMGGPGDFRIGYNSGHMQATLPGGTPVNYGSTPSIQRGGVGGAGADDPAFTEHWFRPAGAGASALGPAGLGGGLGGSIPIPLPVTIVGMGGGGGLPGLGGGAPLGGGTVGNALGGGAGLGVGTAGGGAESWRSTVRGVIARYGPAAGITANNAQAWEDAIVKQIDTESKGDPGAANPNDSNGRGGTQSVAGLLQYLPSSYAASGGKLTGLPYMDPVGQIAGALMAPRTATGAPDTSAPGGIGAGHGWGPTATPLSGGISTAGGGLGGGPGPSMPIGSGLGANPALPGPPSGQYGAQVETGYTGGQGGGLGITPGGSIDTAMNLAASAFPGVGQAAATGMKLGSRAIQYAGQVAGIGVQGLMDTFLPTGGSELANNSWFTRIVGGLAGASPQIPNLAGQQGKQQQQQAPGPLTPGQVQPGQPGVGQGLGAPPITVNYSVNGGTEDRHAADITHHLGQQYSPAGAR